ncbi:MAG TPA: glycerol-3-phosphate 1-O-acyltransferase PlsB [Xanthomonadaceae bacterium]|nr:glycerol-3-phosphate 1-O-acyltransferase PlsB [Xanthomonadaceae bacterium]
MNAEAPDSPGRRRSVGWRLLGRLIEPWIAIRRDPADPAAQLLPGLPVCYVIERYGASNALILEQACREAGLPPPLQPMAGGDLLGRPRSMLALSRRQGFAFSRPRSMTHSDSLARLVEAVAADPALDVQLVPVSIFVGRAPDRDRGWFRVLFSENWAVVGRFRRFLAIVLNGRHTIVKFSAPVSLRRALADELPPAHAVRKIARVLRAHFRRIRSTVIGPDLSHRRTLIDGLLDSEPVQQAIADQARREGIAIELARAKARRYAMEIAADYSHPLVRSASFALTPFWNKLYDGIQVHHFDTLREVAPGHELVYVPCHRSHIDYLLLSYQLYQNSIVPPHIAAGVNLNLPVLGPVLRRGGAFFLRRSFGANPLYSAVFSEYVAMLVGRGVSLEYFIEGGRSRTGRLTPPKGGMLAMTVRAFLRQPRRPVVFVPVYIGYEKLMEGRSYLAELSGKPKRKETLLGLLRAFGVLRHRYGKVALNFGEPVFLDSMLARHVPDWRERTGIDSRPEWLNPLVEDLAEGIMTRINSAADVNPIALLALALLSTPRHAMAESDLLLALRLLQRLLAAVPYSQRVTVTTLTPAQIVAYGEKMQVLRRIPHALGDVLGYEDETAVLQRYYRNNLLHLFAAAAWVACCFQNARRMSRAGIVRLGRLLYPFIKAELFLPWSDEQFAERLHETIAAMCELGLLEFDAASGMVSRGRGQTDEVFQLRVIAHTLLPAFERYYIAIAILVKNGPGTIGTGELEHLCRLTAQRLALLYTPSAPEFYDRALLRGFIGKLRELRIVWTDAHGKLDFDHRLEGWSRDARVILGREVRHSILKMSPETAIAQRPDKAAA